MHAVTYQILCQADFAAQVLHAERNQHKMRLFELVLTEVTGEDPRVIPQETMSKSSYQCTISDNRLDRNLESNESLSARRR